MLENQDSSNGGLIYSENHEMIQASKEDVIKALLLPNTDLVYDDVQKMMNKPRMPRTLFI